jgi:hypothetical protein
MTRTYEAPVVLVTTDIVSATNSLNAPPQENGLFGIDVSAGFCL